jgi:alpha-ketoglutarate-dependent taurine dioxygenase
MSLTVTPRHPLFAAEVRGLDVGQPVSPEDFEALKQALYQYAVLVFPDQELTPQQHIAFSQLFGELYFDQKRAAAGAEFGELMVLGNLNPEGDTFTPPTPSELLTEWHSDHSHRPTAALVSLLYGRAVPDEGADTLFALMTAAHDAAPPDLIAKIKDRVGLHSASALISWRHEVDPGAPALTQERAAGIPVIERPLTKTHTKTGKEALYFGQRVMGAVKDLPPEESKALIQELVDHATQAQFVYAHKWRKHDLVMWDNRAVIHTGTHYDRSKYARLMQRTTVLDNAAGRI